MDYSSNILSFGSNVCRYIDDNQQYFNEILDTNFLAWITHLILFMTFSYGLFHPEGLKMPPLRVWSFWLSPFISSPINSRLSTVISLPFRIHWLFHTYFISSSRRQDTDLFLSLFILSPFLTNCLHIYSHPTFPPPPTPSQLSATMHQIGCFWSSVLGTLVVKLCWW